MSPLTSHLLTGPGEEGIEARTVWPHGGGTPQAARRALRSQPRAVPICPAVNLARIVFACHEGHWSSAVYLVRPPAPAYVSVSGSVVILSELLASM